MKTKIEKSVPVLAEKPKAAKEKKEKAPTMGRSEHTAAVAALSPKGWQIVSKDPVMDKFQCSCNGWGRKGYILEPIGIAPRLKKGGDDETYTGADWADLSIGKAGLVKVGAGCLEAFGIAL